MAATSLRPLILSERNIRDSSPGDILRDSTVKGLHLRVFGKKKSFYLYFRTKAGQERRPKLGDYGVITLPQARSLAKEMLYEVAAGRDPVDERQGSRNEPTLTDLWNEYWKRHGSKKKSGTDDLQKWLARISPRFGKRRLSSIKYPDVARFHESMSSTPTHANRTLSLLSKMFSFAFRPLEWIGNDNPCQGVVRYKERPRRRKASREEIGRLVYRLQKEMTTSNFASAAFLWLLLFTGARKGEIANARWENLDGNRILLDEHKTDDGGYTRIIYLPPAAMDVINRLPKTRGTLTGLQSPQKLWERIRYEENLPNLTMHDLRRTFASVALSTGQVTLEQVMQMLGQTNAQTTKTYAWLMEDVHAQAVGLVADTMTVDIFS